MWLLSTKSGQIFKISCFFCFLVKERIKTNQLKKEKENLEIMRDAA